MTTDLDQATAELVALQEQLDAVDSERQRLADAIPAIRRKATALATDLTECCTVAHMVALQHEHDQAAAELVAADAVLLNLNRRLDTLQRQLDAAALKVKAAERQRLKQRFNELVALDVDTLHSLHMALAIHVNGNKQEVGARHAWREQFGAALVPYCPDSEAIPALYAEATAQ